MRSSSESLPESLSLSESSESSESLMRMFLRLRLMRVPRKRPSEPGAIFAARRAHGCTMGTHGQRAWKRYVAMGWERIGAGGKQHGNNGAVLASAWGMGRGRHLPAPSPALPTNYTNSTATPSAEAKGPGPQGRSLSRFPIKTVGTGMQVELPAANRIPVGGPPPRRASPATSSSLPSSRSRGATPTPPRSGG